MTRIATFILAGALALVVGAAYTPSFAQSSLADRKRAEAEARSRRQARHPQPYPFAECRPARRGRQEGDRARPAPARSRSKPCSLRRRKSAPKSPSSSQDKPKIDLAILFDYNSDLIGPKAVACRQRARRSADQVGPEGQRLRAERSHRCGRQSAEYNLALSHRRAQSVRRYLIETYKIAPDTLLVAGFGKERLKVQDPLAAENRRVEVVNAGQ